MDSHKIISNYLAPSPVTSNGQPKRQKAKVHTAQPTKKEAITIQPAKPVDKTPLPPSTDPMAIGIHDNHSVSNVFCCVALGGAHTGTFYTDTTVIFLVASLETMQAYCFAYDYDMYTILVKQCPDFKDDIITTVFEDVCNELKIKGYTPACNVPYNQATAQIKAFLNTKGCKWQFVEPLNHCVNITEKAIQTFKKHFTSGLSSPNRHWLLQLWVHLSTKVTLPLNLLCTLRIDPTKLAYKLLNGHKYDSSTHQLAPTGTRTVIYIDSVIRTSCGPRGFDVWYCGPSMDPSCCSHFFVPETSAIQTGGSFDLFPKHYIMPTFTCKEHATTVLDELREAVLGLYKKAK